MEYITECLINGTKMVYDDCCDDKYLERYLQNKNLKKIGEGYTFYINGIENTETDLHHYFVRVNQNKNENEFFNLKLPSIEKVDVKKEKFEAIANKILNTECSKKSRLEKIKEDFLNFVVFGKTSYYHVPSKQENNNK